MAEEAALHRKPDTMSVLEKQHGACIVSPHSALFALSQSYTGFFNFLCKWLNVISERETRIYLLSKILIYSSLFYAYNKCTHQNPPLDQVWLFQPSVISRPPPHYREIMPNYRKVIFLLPP